MRTLDIAVAFAVMGASVLQPGVAVAEDAASYPAVAASPVPDGEHDFDFNLGAWNVHMRRRLHPLTGSNDWTTLDGTVVVRKVWGGAGNLAEIAVDGSSGHLEFMSLRLYDARTHEWSLNFSTKGNGSLGVPMIGHFRNGRADFYDQEPFDGRTILVRFSIFRLDGTYRDEQSFSSDGGATWEVNWINTFTKASGG
jgi:hypothetical protein